jgi:hypothetical protein
MPDQPDALIRTFAKIVRAIAEREAAAERAGPRRTMTTVADRRRADTGRTA